MIRNYHTHTVRCHHAEGTEEEYILRAIEAGFTTLGFSDHAPINIPNFISGFRMEPDKYHDYAQTVLSLRDKYADKIKIYLGVEMEYYPDIFDEALDYLLTEPLDYMILGQHFTNNEYDGEYVARPMVTDKRVLERYAQQIEEAAGLGLFTYIAHPDLILYDISAPEYRENMLRICEAAKKNNLPLEINLLGKIRERPYPHREFFEIAAECGNEIIIGLDAHSADGIHSPETQEAVDWAMELVRELGLKLTDKPNLIKPVKI